LTGAEASVVVNNNAAATLLMLAALASGREVIVSRGELVEIGGGFRVPEVMAQSGAILREVGTTNRTRTADYAAAINERTAAILRVHPSNFRIEGFTERPELGELAALAHRFSLPLLEDLGSGLIQWDAFPHQWEEPTVGDSVTADVDVVAFSGDKLLGGPQAGILVGKREPLETIRRHPLMRAVRADKLALATLEATLALWARPPRWEEIPVVRMISLTLDEMDRRAQAFVEKLPPQVRVTIIDGASTIGGGSAPGSSLPTRLVAVEIDGLTASALELELRKADPPIIARIQDDRVVIDLRTVHPQEEAHLLRTLALYTEDTSDT
jgi:L-seryl-tRNA(Ser) seleniumtransferase